MTNKNISGRRGKPNDELYTQISDVCEAVGWYTSSFEGANVFLPCDSDSSAFWQVLSSNFERLKIKNLDAHEYKEGSWGRSSFIYETGTSGFCGLGDHGSFEGEDSIEKLIEADLVFTNPPFSKITDFVNLLMKHDKKFLIIAPVMAATHSKLFNFIKDEKMWFSKVLNKSHFIFDKKNGGRKKLGNVGWLTNIETSMGGDVIWPLELRSKYDRGFHKKYDNYNAIEVPEVKLIPKDFKGVMGVPVTYLLKHDPEQFKILGLGKDLSLNKKLVFKRVLIQSH